MPCHRKTLAASCALMLFLTGCQFPFGGGTGGTGDGDANAAKALNQVEEDYREGRISREVYLERKRAIEEQAVFN